MNLINTLFNRTNNKRRNELARYQLIDGWLTPNEANGLFDVAARLPMKAVVVEIGSWKGKSTWCIAQGLKSGVINCIDPFNADGEEGSKEIYAETKGSSGLLEQFNFNLKNVPPSVTIKALAGYSNEFVNTIPDIDLLFIDGDHSIDGCRFDFENYSGAVKPGGFLAFHDYDPTRKDLGPTWVIENLIKDKWGFRLFGQFDSLAVFKKD